MVSEIVDSFQHRFGSLKVAINLKKTNALPAEGFIVEAHRSADEITAQISYRNENAVRYALNSLLSFSKSSEQDFRLESSPDFPIRGVVEGFYGPPWTHEQRLKAIVHFGDFNLNTYFIAPKDVPWQRFNWRAPFSEAFLSSMQELVGNGKRNGIEVTASVSPGLSVKYSDAADVAAVVNRFRQLYELGCRHFSLLWDDIDWELSHPEDITKFSSTASAQAWFTNEVWRSMLEIDNNIQMSVCPMQYCGRGNEPYLSELGSLLSPRVNLMWTGREICSGYLDISDAVIFERNALRPPLYWDNFPVNDGSMQRSLYIGPIRNREKGLQKYSAGLLSNPMLQFEMSLFPLKTVGDYLWDSEGYDPERSWESGLQQLVPDEQSRTELRRFMRCTMGTNVGGDPAPDLRKVFRKGVSLWRSGNLTESGDTFIQEGKALIDTHDFLCSHKFAYPEILVEILPWLDKFKFGAEALLTVGEQLKKCSFDAKQNKIVGDAAIVNKLREALSKFSEPKKSLFGDQIDGPINELIAELNA